MIATFKAMTLFGAGDASAVSGGIAEALITTELGLVVAIPALLAHALMSRRVKSYFAQLENDAVHLSQLPVPNERGVTGESMLLAIRRQPRRIGHHRVWRCSATSSSST